MPEDNRTERMRVGHLAEDDARLRLNNAGYDTYSIKNSSGQGTDIIAINRETGNIRVIEVKSRSSDLSDVQRDGGYDHSNDVLRRFREGRNSTWTDEGFLQQLRGLGYDRNNWTSDPRVNYEVWSYQDADLATGNAGTPIGTRWSPGTSRRLTNGQPRLWFQIDAETGELLRDRPGTYANPPEEN